MGNDPEGVAAALRGVGANSVAPDGLGAVQIPVLLINGREDPADSATGRLLEVLPNTRVVTCDGDHLSAPGEPSFQEAVVGFLLEGSGTWSSDTRSASPAHHVERAGSAGPSSG